MESMDYITTKEWLNRQLELKQEGEDSRELNSSVAVYSEDSDILMSKGIELVADIMGLDLVEEVKPGTDYNYPYWYSFVYGGVKFVQIEKERLVSENVSV